MLAVTNFNHSFSHIDLGSVDPDTYLDERDAPELQPLWEQAEAAIAAEKAKTPERTLKSLQRDDQKYREEVFRWVMRVTGHSELAAQVSDDLGLLQQAYWHGVAGSPYINALAQAYRMGRLPVLEDFEVDDFTEAG